MGPASAIASSCTCKTHAMYSTMCIGTWEGMGIAARRVSTIPYGPNIRNPARALKPPRARRAGAPLAER
eukprot:scaffold122650_cov73-Phaeocystis_antarctica.AAC.1